MKFNRILEQYVKESEALTKIMLKVDPANSINKDYRDFDGYEGYILKENNNKWSVLFENIDIPVMDVPFSVIKVVDIPCDETFNNVKMFGLKTIEERKGLTMEIISKIQACNSVDFLEQYLKEEGLNDSEIKDVYKKALLGNTISEGLIRKISDGIKRVAKAAKDTVDKVIPEFPALRKGIANPVDDLGKPVKWTSPFFLDYAFQTAADDLSSRFNKRTPRTEAGCIKVQRNFNAVRKVKVDIRQNVDVTNNILNYFNQLEVCAQYLTHNKATGDIFKPKMRNNIIEYIEICNPSYSSTSSLDKNKFKNFFETLDSQGRANITQSQYYSFFNNPRFTP